MSAGFTVTASPGEQLVPVGLPCAESVTLYEKVVVDERRTEYVDEIIAGIGDVHRPSEYHW
jgi:hypothetical protein